MKNLILILLFGFEVILNSGAQTINRNSLKHAGDSLQIPRQARSGMGTYFGLGMTSFAGLVTLNCRIEMPVSPYFSLGIRPFYIANQVTDSTTSIGGRLEFIGRSPVMLNILRVYIA